MCQTCLVLREELRLRETGVIGLCFGDDDDWGQPGAQTDRQSGQQSAEVAAGGGQAGIGGVADGVGEEVSAHPALGLVTADARLDRGAAVRIAFDRLIDAPFRAEDIEPNSALERGFAAAIASVGDDA